MDDVLGTIGAGLTYDGNLFHILINYALLVLTVSPFFLAGDPTPDAHRARWLGCLLIAVVIQGIVWFSANAVGVSLVWSILAGYTVSDILPNRSRLSRERHRLATAALVGAGGGIVYYAIAFPILTTVAHVSGVVVGIGLYYLLRLVIPGQKATR